MTEEEVLALLRDLPGSRPFTASADNGAPEAAWGDTFCYYDPEGTEDQKWPFATVVVHDTPGWDEVSDLDRDGVFRVNLHVGRGHVPNAPDDIDYSQTDVVMPHPQYAAQGWAAIVSPADRELLADLASTAYERAAKQ
jgi:hypothetical protein